MKIISLAQEGLKALEAEIQGKLCMAHAKVVPQTRGHIKKDYFVKIIAGRSWEARQSPMSFSSKRGG